MKNRFLLVLVAFSLFSMTKTRASQRDLYGIDSIQKIQIFFHQSNWDYMMDTSRIGLDGYVMADSVIINGKSMDSIGVKYKGNSSYNANVSKNPLSISLDEFTSHKYQSYKSIKLSNCYQDPSMIREVLAYNILAKYMHCPQANFAQVYINGAYYGVYSNIENINKQFCATHFNSGEKTLIKCNPTVVSPALKSNLKFISTDSNDYYKRYELKSDYGWGDLISLSDSLTKKPAMVSSLFNIDRVTWMLAFNNVFVNLDSYSGLYAQNYFVNKDASGKWNPIIWDLNMSFGGFPYSGLGSSNTAMLSTQTMMAQLSPLLHSNDAYWPLIKAVLNDNSLKKQYIAHMRTLLDENFSNALYETTATKYQALIDTAVASDTAKFFSYVNFQKGLTDSVKGNNYIYGIKSLMDARAAFLKAHAEFVKVPPIISNVQARIANDSIYFSAKLSKAVSVFLGVRSNVFESFTKNAMHDDGLLSDTTASDSVYSFVVPVNSMAVAQYYIYAENADAGIFSPVRAEHEFYSIETKIPVAQKGQVVINECMASNKSTIADETGAFADWVELYNTTNQSLNLSGLYLSDDPANLAKSIIPQNTIIKPNSYVSFWLDGSSSSAFSLHGNFKLSASGDNIFLSDNTGTIFDSISFGTQLSDVSYGRYPNGTGNFVIMSKPTWNTENTIKTDVEIVKRSSLQCYPNPAKNSFELKCSAYPQNVIITNVLGEIVVQQTLNESKHFSTERWNTGMYFVKTANDVTSLMIVK